MLHFLHTLPLVKSIIDERLRWRHLGVTKLMYRQTSNKKIDSLGHKEGFRGGGIYDGFNESEKTKF